MKTQTQTQTTTAEPLVQRALTLLTQRRDALDRQIRVLTSATGDAAGAPADGSRFRRRMVMREPLQCKRCKRTFAHPMHLGRHVSAAHRAKAS